MRRCVGRRTRVTGECLETEAILATCWNVYDKSPRLQFEHVSQHMDETKLTLGAKITAPLCWISCIVNLQSTTSNVLSNIHNTPFSY